MKNYLTSVYGVAVQVFSIVWNLIVGWFKDSLSPWIKENLSPLLNDATKDALVAIDSFASPLSRLVKKAWNELRKFLAKSIITFEKKVFDGKIQWVRCWSMEMFNIVEPAKPRIVVTKTVELIPFDQVPQELRESYLRSGSGESEPVDFLKARDNEMAMVH